MARQMDAERAWLQQTFAQDPDRAMSARFAPAAKRRGLLLLIAIDGDLARIGVRVHEPLLCSIRFQFWRDGLADDAGAGHPLIREARTCFHNSDSVLRGFVALVNAHEQLADDTLSHSARMIPAARREAVLFRLAHDWLADGDAGAGEAFYDACGKSYGFLRQLWVNPADAARRESDGAALQSEVLSAYEGLRPELRRLSVTERPALLPVALVPTYLRHLKKAGQESGWPVDLRPVRKLLRLWRTASFGF